MSPNVLEKLRARAAALNAPIAATSARATTQTSPAGRTWPTTPAQRPAH